ncbi:site-specific DNA-methyltransferase [Lactococcus kimchii]|uniref:site-specific DNA-methyltransferase n=1 Tax=Lactococcus sp. S-13 TaxID=2507158 RepID=UPI001022FF44|nr:site-specific DNA-methyltransferase [Lactococcus sp. S-13]RZI48126.1 site-specific DNA-methyltransferase [Lactococcus sp. S-13]
MPKIPFDDRPHKNEKQESIDFVKSLIEQARTDARDSDIPKLEKLIQLLNSKKYGLVWEEHAELVEEEMKTKIPVFVEDQGKKINDNPDSEDFNFLLEGDNLHSLHLLEKTHLGKIDVIYIDPPYNTGTKEGAFRYNDKLILNDDSYIHSKWLSFINVRLKIAERLLTNDGVLFLHIDENEYAQIKLLLDELFGEDAFVENLIWNKRVPKNDKGIGAIHEYILVYSKNKKNEFLVEKEGLEEIFSLVENAKKSGKTPLESQNMLKQYYRENEFPRAITLYNNVDNNYKIFGKINMSWPNANTFGPRYDVLHPKTKNPVKVPDRGWRWRYETLKDALNGDFQELEDGGYLKGRIWYAKDEKTQISSINYLEDTNRMLLRSIISLKSDGSLELEKLGFRKNDFAYAKPVSLAKELLESITFSNKNAIILDFFAGSGTTGQAVAELNNEDGGNRKFILATNNENNIAEEVTYERMKRVSSGTEKYEAKPMNLKYLKTDFVIKEKFPNVSLEYELLRYITPLVELEFTVDIVNPKVQIVITDGQLESLIENNELVAYSTLFMHPDIFRDAEQNQVLSDLQIKVQEIPNYFFGMELWSK